MFQWKHTAAQDQKLSARIDGVIEPRIHHQVALFGPDPQNEPDETERHGLRKVLHKAGRGWKFINNYIWLLCFVILLLLGFRVVQRLFAPLFSQSPEVIQAQQQSQNQDNTESAWDKSRRRIREAQNGVTPAPAATPTPSTSVLPPLVAPCGRLGQLSNLAFGRPQCGNELGFFGRLLVFVLYLLVFALVITPLCFYDEAGRLFREIRRHAKGFGRKRQHHTYVAKLEKENDKTQTVFYVNDQKVGQPTKLSESPFAFFRLLRIELLAELVAKLVWSGFEEAIKGGLPFLSSLFDRGVKS
jgi:hypothetical protein